MPTVVTPTRSTPDEGARPEKCNCPWRLKYGKKYHARMLRLETDADPWQYLLDDGVSKAFSDAAEFVAYHSWSDPAKMMLVRQSCEFMARKLRHAALWLEAQDAQDELAAEPILPSPEETGGLSITETRDRLYPHELSLEAHAGRIQALEDALQGGAFLVGAALGGTMTRQYFEEVATRAAQA
jgi:hypothetical protein